MKYLIMAVVVGVLSGCVGHVRHSNDMFRLERKIKSLETSRYVYRDRNRALLNYLEVKWHMPPKTESYYKKTGSMRAISQKTMRRTDLELAIKTLEAVSADFNTSSEDREKANNIISIFRTEIQQILAR